MKYAYAIALLLACWAASPALAQTADDTKWINQCIQDNKDEKGATPTITRAYCTCMNDKMDNNESRSITQWEKSHPDERKLCEKQAGWK
jgi:hypothetical protein